MSKYKWLLDAGDGGIIPDGRYVNAPDKMHVFRDGLTVHEGAINRLIMDLLIKYLEYEKIEYELVYDEFIDLPIAERVSAANKFYAEDKRCIFVSIHSDKMPEGGRGKKTGFGIYTSMDRAIEKVDSTRSKAIARIFVWGYDIINYQSGFKFRKDYVNGCTHEDFRVLDDINCPAVLVENLFYNDRKHAKYLLSEKGQLDIATAIYYAIAFTEDTEVI